jgi:hypothetical protein
LTLSDAALCVPLKGVIKPAFSFSSSSPRVLLGKEERNARPELEKLASGDRARPLTGNLTTVAALSARTLEVQIG